MRPMRKIMGKLKHNYNAFPELQTKFFSNNVSFGHFRQVSENFIPVSTFSKFQVQLPMRKKEVSPTKLFQIQQDKSKVSSFIKDQWYSDACKNSTDFNAKCKGSELRQVAHRKSHWEAKWVKSWIR